MTSDPTAPQAPARFSGKLVLAVLGGISLLMCAIVIIASQRDVTRALDERSQDPAVFEDAAALTVAHTDPAAPPVADDEPGWWRCTLGRPTAENDPNEITFALWLPEQGDSRSAYIRNGDEFIQADAEWDGESLSVAFAHFDSKIEASAGGLDEGSLAGVWWKQRPDSVDTMPFRAARVERFDDCYPLPGMEFPGMLHADQVQWSEPETWRLVFDGSGPAKGVFQSGKVGPIRNGQPDHRPAGAYRWKGAILTPTGDYRYLYGAYELEQEDGYQTMEGYLTVFDGAHAFLFTFHKSDGPEGVTGVFYSGGTYNEPFTATLLEQGQDYKLPDPFSQVHLRPGETRLNIPLLDDPTYRGKPVIVEVMGTWCPNCHDANRLLAELYNEHHKEGLQILGLAYEHTDDEARSLIQIERFKERIGATWNIVPAGLSDKKQTSSTLPALTDIKSYPTTIFLNKDHTVEAIHSGFSGPATGAEYDKTREEFTRLIRKILDS